VPSPQSVLQLPQWALSFWKSTHCVPQSTCPEGQNDSHAPLLQQLPALQATPQAPQFALSLLKSTHWVPHRT
jgi:hypothetical protein